MEMPRTLIGHSDGLIYFNWLQSQMKSACSIHEMCLICCHVRLIQSNFKNCFFSLELNMQQTLLATFLTLVSMFAN